MTYLAFHFVFTIPLLLLTLLFNFKNRQAFSKKSLQGILLLLVLCISYTTPWDSYLIKNNIWSYSKDNVVGQLWYIPFEEYFFFFIQTIIGCLLTSFFYFKFNSEKLGKESFQLTTRSLLLTLISILSIEILLLLAMPNEKQTYLKLILIWALPIILLQAFLGWRTLLKNKSTLVISIFSLTLYFCLADSYAILQKIWVLPEATVTGLKLFSILPIEEALFFFLTNIMVVQGYLLFTLIDFKNIRLQPSRSSK